MDQVPGPSRHRDAAGSGAADVRGDRDPQTVADEHFWFAHELRPSNRWLPDLTVLTRTPTRIVIGIGADSAGQACDHTSQALAATLGLDRTTFPGDHTGFLGDPDGFAARLRAVLDPASTAEHGR